MKLTVLSHKLCWPSPASSSGYATSAGFPFQMRALSELFDATTVVVPCSPVGPRAGEAAITGRNLRVAALTVPSGKGWRRKAALLFWVLRNVRTLVREVLRAEAVHAVIPGDVGTVGMLLAWVLRKRLLVRHCGNWLVQRTHAERFWRWFIEGFAGGRNVMLVTGGAAHAPSRRNGNVRWVFSTALTEQQLLACGRGRDRPPNGSPQLIIAGRQDWEKGTGVVLESLPLILPHFPGARLHVAGDGEALEDFKNLAGRLGVRDRVVFHGLIGHDPMLDLLRAADLFCFPTAASEGFPKVVLEALACGLPVITTRVSVLPQMLASGCGRLIDEATPGAVAEAVRSCLSDPDAYRAMSAQAVRTAQQYSLERWRDTIGGFLRAAWGPLRDGD